jgi:hypothetical protein
MRPFPQNHKILQILIQLSLCCQELSFRKDNQDVLKELYRGEIQEAYPGAKFLLLGKVTVFTLSVSTGNCA